MSSEQSEPTGPTGDPGPIPPSGVHPDLLDYARQTFNLEEYLVAVRQAEAEGGALPLEAFIGELEALARGS